MMKGNCNLKQVFMKLYSHFIEIHSYSNLGSRSCVVIVVHCALLFVLCEFGNIFQIIQYIFTLLPTSLHLGVEVELGLVCCKGKKCPALLLIQYINI